MAKNTVRVDVRIASPTVKRFGNADQAAQEIVDGMFSASLNKVRQRTNISLRGLEKTLQVAAQREYMNAMRFITKDMMGRLSPESGKEHFRIVGGERIRIATPTAKISIPLLGKPTGHFQGQVEWDPLARQTLQFKKKHMGSRAKARQYFIHTGALKRELTRKARTLVKRTGLVSVRYRDRGKTGTIGRLRKVDTRSKTVPLADLVIRIAPRIPAVYLQGVNAGDPNKRYGMEFERKLGISNDALAKLAGTTKHRPMFQPVFSYWTIFHVPNAVANRLYNILIQGAGPTGVEDYSGG